MTTDSVTEVEKQMAPRLWNHAFALAPAADWQGMSGECPGVTGIVFNTGDPEKKDQQFVVHTDGQLAATAPPGCTVIEDVPESVSEQKRPASYAILVRQDLVEYEPRQWRVLGQSVVEVHYDLSVDPAVIYDALAKIKGEANE
jgi:hypothetical protein